MGQFSWFTQDTDRQIGSQPENTIKVTMFDDKGNSWEERNYEGYGVFGGKDYYELVAEMNGWNEDNYKENDEVMAQELRDVGIHIYFDEENKGYKFPGLRQVYLPHHVKMHDFTKKPIDDPNQSWYSGDDEYDEDGYFERGGEVVYTEDELKYALGVDDDYEHWVELAFQRGYKYDESKDEWYLPDDYAKGGKVNPYFVRQSFYSEITPDGKEELDNNPEGIIDGYTGTGNDTRGVYYVEGYNYLLEEEPENIDDKDDEVFRVTEEIYIDYTDKNGKKQKAYMEANSPDEVVRTLKEKGAKSIERMRPEWEVEDDWDAYTDAPTIEVTKTPDVDIAKKELVEKLKDVDIAGNFDDKEYSPDNPHPMAGVTSGKQVVNWDGEWVSKASLKKDKVNNKKIEKAIADEINKFDKVEDGYYRYKYWEADEYKGDWFVDYITQEDYRNEGEDLLLGRLEKIAKKFKVNIYLYYKVRDNAATSDRNKATKKGYIEAVEIEVSDADIVDAVYGMDKWLPDDDDSIREFQDIEDNGTVEDMIEYLNGWGDEDRLYERYGLTSDNYTAIAKKIMGKPYAKGGKLSPSNQRKQWLDDGLPRTGPGSIGARILDKYGIEDFETYRGWEEGDIDEKNLRTFILRKQGGPDTKWGARGTIQDYIDEFQTTAWNKIKDEDIENLRDAYVEYGNRHYHDYDDVEERREETYLQNFAKGGETKQTIAVYDMDDFLQSQLDYFIENPKEFEERADYLLEDEYEREKYEEDKEEYIRNWFYSSDSDSYDWYWDDVKEELAIEFDKYIDDRVFVKGSNMGWRNREGTKTFVLEDTEQMITELVPENTDFTYYLYKIKDGEYEARVSHHDSPMGEYFEIKIQPNYINRIYLENNDGERIGLIYVDSSELGKVEKLEDHEFENFSYWKDEDEDDEGNYVVLQYDFEDTKKNIDKNFDEFVKRFPNSTLTEDIKEINY